MIRKIVAIALILFAVSVAAAEDAPAMWMEQDNTTVKLMVNTSDTADGVNAWIHFNPAAIDITDVNFSEGPWQPVTPPGWSNQGDYIIISLLNFTGVPAGEYEVATIDVACIEDGPTNLSITHAEPTDVVLSDLQYVCGEAPPPDPPAPDPDPEAEISIGDGSGVVTIPISVVNATDAGAVDITLTYDPAVVNVTGVADGAMDCTYTNLENRGDGWIRIGAVQGDNPGLDGAFSLLNISFEPVTTGASCALNLTVTTYRDATPNCTAMNYTVVCGTYTAPSTSILGDANSDGVVDIMDASYIAKHVIGLAGYEYIDEVAANVNGDEIVDMSDSMYLTKHVMGMTGFENLR